MNKSKFLSLVFTLTLLISIPVLSSFKNTTGNSLNRSEIKRPVWVTMNGVMQGTVGGCQVSFGVQITFIFDANAQPQISNVNVTIVGVNMNCGNSGIISAEARIGDDTFDAQSGLFTEMSVIADLEPNTTRRATLESVEAAQMLALGCEDLIKSYNP